MYHDLSLIGIKGRIQNREYETSEEVKRHVVEVITEKVTFLSSPKESKKAD